MKTTANLLSAMRQIPLLFIALTCITLNAVANAANITVTTSRNPVALDDSFHLLYEADSSVDGAPDFTPIYQNFDVLSSSQSTNMRSINGSWSLKKTWDLAVIAKDIGTFTIPPISFGNDTSPAIQVTINNSTSPNSLSPKAGPTVPATIFLESLSDTKTTWINAQFIYTVRLLRTVGIANASLSDPVSSDADAIIKKIAEDNYQTTRNGIQYEVFERRYAVFPQKSGLLKINPITFEGRINAKQPRTIFDQFRMSGQLKRLRSKAVEIQIKAKPAAINLQDWLPASNLQLIEEWSDDIQNLKAGEPVTRTITLVAEGLTGVQLPDLDFSDIDGIKQYADNSIIENRENSNGITGLKQIKIALIPARTGEYILPEIKLQWWNTKTNKKQLASIPQTILSVTGTAIQNTIPAPSADNRQISPIEPLATNNKIQAPQFPVAANEPYWKGLAAFFATAWLFTLILLYRKSSTDKKQNKIKQHATDISIKSAIAAVEKNAKKNDTDKTRKALISWAQLIYNNKTISNLTQISEHCSSPFSQQIQQLNQSMYGSEKHTWQGKNLLIAFRSEQALKNKKTDAAATALKPLYNK